MDECEKLLLRRISAPPKQAEKIPRPNYALIYIRASFFAKATKDKSMGNIIFSDLSSESLLKEEARMQ